MAIGGSLRAALRAGNWAKTAMESRRRARALSDLNARGGIVGSREMASPASRGFTDEFGGGIGFGPRDRVVTRNHMTGARHVPDTLSGYPSRGSRGYYDNNPIQAPYEGFRVLPGGPRRVDDLYDWGMEQPPGPWMGRGAGTDWRGGYPRGMALEETGPWEWGPSDFNFFPNDWGYSSLPQSYRQTAWPWVFSGNMPPALSRRAAQSFAPEIPF